MIRRLTMALGCCFGLLPGIVGGSDEGGYFEISGHDSPTAFGAELGRSLENDHIQFRYGYALIAHEDLQEFFYTGPIVGMRVFSNDNVAPFIGLSGFIGWYEQEIEADDDHIDNDNDGFIDEYDETKSEVADVVAAIIPEVGIKFGDETGSITLFGKYHITTDGNTHDFWTVGLGFRF